MKYNFKTQAFWTKCIAWFLILLILESTLVFATSASLVNVSVTGSNGALNAVQTVDDFTIIATVNPNGETLEAVQERLTFGQNQAQQTFAQCVLLDSGFIECQTSQFRDFSSTTTTQGSIGVTLYNYVYIPNNPNEVKNTQSRTFLIDRASPTIVLSSVRQAGNNVTVQMTLSDSVSTSSAQCSGLANTEIFFGGVLVGSGNLNRTCVLSTSFSFDATSAQSQSYPVCVKVTDAVGNSNQVCRSLTIDKTPPTLGNITLIREDGMPTRFVSQSGTQLRVQIAHTDAVTANLRINNQSVPFTCSQTHCVSTPSIVSQTSTLQISGQIFDAAGNPANVNQAITATLDSARPVAKSVTSSVTRNGRHYVTQNATLTVSFDETGSGFMYNRPILRIGDVSVVAQNCSPSWTCTYRISPTQQGEYSPFVSGFDDAGNPVQMNVSNRVIVDTLPPQISNLDVKGEFAGLSQFNLSQNSSARSLIIAGGVAVAEFTVIDNVAVSLSADFRAIGGGIVTSTCVGSCSIKSNTLQTGGLKGQIILNATDEAGNTASVTSQAVYVLKDETDSDQDYFTHSLSLTPSTIETTTSEFVQQRAYAIIKTKPYDQGLVLETKLVSCGNVGSYVNPSLANTNAGSGTTAGQTAAQVIANYQGQSTGASGSGIAYFQSYKEVDTGTADEMQIEFVFKAVAIKEEQIAIDCLISVGGVTQTAFVGEEFEVAKIVFETFEFSMGTLPDNYEKELNAAISDANDGLLNTLAKLGRFVMWARKLCQLLTAIETISSVLGGVGSILGKLGFGLTSTGVGAVAGEPIGAAGDGLVCGSETTTQANGQLMKAFDKICQFVNCEISIWDTLGKGGLFNSKGSPGTPQAATPGTNGAGSQSSSGPGTGTPQPAGSTADRSGTGFGNAVKESFFTKETILASKTSGNLVVNLVNLCIPGLILNMNEYRQIKCKYVLCLLEDVPNGTPIQACQDAKEYSVCVYLLSNIFGALNIVNFWNSIVEAIKQIFINPIALVGLAQGFCTWACGQTWAAKVYDFCYTINQLSRIVSLYRNIMQIIEFAQNPMPADQDYCKAMDTKLKERERTQQSQMQGSPGGPSGGTSWS
jgi:hypothetical protein